MKRLLARMLAVCGLVPAGRYRLLKKVADESRTASGLWKIKAREGTTRLRKLAKTEESRAKLAERLRGQDSELAALQERLTIAEGELTAAREQLMAVEVKLDILEGAANVLDLRTRVAVSRQQTESGASS
jgi:alanyl-tRNA synthetase